MAYIMTERDETAPRHDSCFPVTEQIANDSVEVIERIPQAVLSIHIGQLMENKIYRGIIIYRIKEGFDRRGIIEGSAFTRFILSSQARSYGVTHHEITTRDALIAYIRDTQEKLGNSTQIEEDIRQFKKDLSTSDPYFLEALEKLARKRNYGDAFFVSAYDYYHTSRNAYETEKIRKMFQIDTNSPES